MRGPVVILAAALRPWWLQASPPPPMLLVAADNLRPLFGRWRAMIAFGLGLVHGLGFAGALQALGLPPAALGHALVAFNVGVECAQLVLVAVVVPVAYGLRQWVAMATAAAACRLGVCGAGRCAVVAGARARGPRSPGLIQQRISRRKTGCPRSDRGSCNRLLPAAYRPQSLPSSRRPDPRIDSLRERTSCD